MRWIRAVGEWIGGRGAKAPAPGSRARATANSNSNPNPNANANATPDPFASYAAALGIEVPADPPPLSADEEAEDERVARVVLERCAASRPEPASFPAIALEVLNFVARADADAAALARLVARDPALSAGVLSVANSPMYRGVMEIETVRDAVTRLGIDEVARVAAAVSARTLFSPKVRAEQAAFGARWTDLFVRAVAVGGAAAASALRRPGARADRAYLGGLLHDVGRPLALRALAALVRDGAVPDPGPERLERVLDRVHVEVGGEAHQAWNLPAYLTAICVRHHDDAVPADGEFADLHLVRLASALADLGDARRSARAAREVAQSAAAVGLDPFAVRALASEVRQAQERARAAFRARP